MLQKISCHLSEEFQTTKLSLNHSPIDDFFKSQWQKKTNSIWWLSYKWLLALFFLVGTLNTVTRNWWGGIWWIYFTDWGLLLCTATTLFGAVLASIWHWKPSILDEAHVTVKIYWALHWSTLVLAAMISFVYWIFLFPYDTTGATKWNNLFAHAFNSIFMVVDHMLVAFPSRLLHVVYPFTIAGFYLIFTLIYYFSGGVNIQGCRYIYPILDWSDAGRAILTVCLCAVLLFLFSFLTYLLYKLRSYCYERSSLQNSKTSYNV